MSLRDWAVSASACGVAMVLFGMPTVTSFAADQFQSGADLLGTPPKQSGPPPNTGTPEQTAKLAAAAGKYDIAGMKLGMPLKEAMQTLKAHNPKLQMKKDMIKYDVLGGELLYGLTFMSPDERFIFSLTMPPNPIVVSRLARVLIFTKGTAPTQQVIVDGLIQKYGQPSYDNGPKQFNDTNIRILNWLDDADGSRMQDETGQLCTTSNSFTGIPHRSAAAAQMPAQGVAMLIESRFSIGQGDVCETRRMVQARLQRCCREGLGAPDLVGALVVHMGDGPLDEQATGATHEMLVNAVKARMRKTRQAHRRTGPNSRRLMHGPITRTFFPATDAWIQDQQAKAANKNIEKAKQQGVKPAL